MRRIITTVIICLALAFVAQLQAGLIKFAAVSDGAELRQSGHSRFFLETVGGVAFEAVAKPDATITGPLQVQYNRTQPNGRRFTLSVGNTSYTIEGPDWMIVPAVVFSDSPWTAAFTLTGDSPNGKQVHSALAGKAMAEVVAYADAIPVHRASIRDVQVPDDMSDMPFVSQFDPVKSEAALASLRLGLILARPRSYIYWDHDVDVTFGVKNGVVTFTGAPYLMAWRPDGKSWQKVTIPGLDSNPQMLHDICPAVYQTAERFGQQVALFRAIKQLCPPQDWDMWMQTMRSLHSKVP